VAVGVTSADGSVDPVGVGSIWVGVGTGGSVRLGSGVSEMNGSGAGGAVVAAGAAVVVGPGTTGADDRAGDGVGEAAVGVFRVGTVVAAGGLVGAVPIPPAPAPAPAPVTAGAPTTATGWAGRASVQPSVTANGSPKATSPTKTDLGDNCTPVQPVRGWEKLRSRIQNGVDRYSPGRLLSAGLPLPGGSHGEKK
jgi:hypothetical protein